MKVRYWGVRGSIPMPGAATARYGGNSSCVEVQLPGAPPVVLDCGTGARALGRRMLEQRSKTALVLFSHFHADHVFGFPFFGPLYAPGSEITVGVPAYSAVDARSRLGRYLNGVHHPVRIRDVAANLDFLGVRPSRPFDFGPYTIQGIALNHPGGSTGYRIDAGGYRVCYITDTAPLARPGEGLVDGARPPGPERRLLALIENADLVVMDTMFDWEEYLEKMTWGHAYPGYAAQLCEAAGAKRLALFHHAPDATDDELDARARLWSARSGPLEIHVACEGQEIDLAQPVPAVAR